jgi:hypothetical protein
MPFDGMEKRSEPRRSYHAPINFILKEKENENRMLKGVVSNISMSGLGMYSFSPLNVGQVIIVKSLLPGRHIEYGVRWCRELVADFYEVGLKMVDGGLPRDAAVS